MTTALKLRRGTTTQHSTFTGAAGEVTVDTDKKTVVVHDGATAGGFPVLKEANPSYTGTLTGGTGVINIGSGQLYKDTSGNIGVGLTPSSSNLPTIQSNYGLLVGNVQANILTNAYYNSGFKYVGTGYAAHYRQLNGNHEWHTAPSGSADGAITFTERVRIDTSGNVGIGTGSPGQALHVYRGTLDAYGRFQTADAGRECGIHLINTAGDTYIYKNAANNNLAIYQNGADRFRITSAGDLQFNSGYGSPATAYGCRAWVNFNGTGTVAIRGSGNVSSITDNGIADYTVNFTNAMPDVNYATTFSASNVNDTTGTNGTLLNTPTSYKGTGSQRFLCFNLYNGGANYSQDVPMVTMAFFR